MAVMVVVALALAARLVAQLVLGFYGAPEIWEEGVIAESLARGHGYVYDVWGTTHQAFRAPAYAFLLAGAYVAFGSSSLTAGLVQLVLGGVLAATVLVIGARVGGSRAGVLAGILVATHPGLVVYSAKVHQLNLDAPLAAVGILLALRLVEGPRRVDLFSLGLVGGLMVLSRPTLLPVVAVGAILPIVVSRRRWPAVARATLVVLLASAVALAWIARNQAVVGVPTLTTGTGITLWIGHNSVATGGTLTDDGRPILDAAPEMRDAIWGKSEVEQDRIFTRAAVTYIADDPLRAVRAVGRNLVLFWSFGSQAGALYPAGWLVAYQLYYWPVLGLAILGLGLLVIRGRIPIASAFMLSLAGVAVAQSLFYVDGRHRWMIEPLLLVLCALAISTIVFGARARLAAR